MERLLAEFATGMLLYDRFCWVNEGATGGGNSSQHKEGGGYGVPNSETAVLFSTYATTKILIICGRNFETDSGAAFCHYCVFPFTLVLLGIMKCTAL